MKLKLALALTLSLLPRLAFAAELVSDETIKTQKELTKVLKLKNGIPVVLRSVPESDILQLDVVWSHGLKELPTGKKALNEWLWTALPMAGKGYPKAVVNETSEQYGLEIGCAGGIEVSTCSLGTLNDFWDKALPLFSNLVNQPAFTDEDIKLSKDRIVATFKNVPSDPGSYVNEIVNSVYYPAGHPYRLNHDEALAELDKLGKADLEALHKTVLNAGLMSLVVVSSMDGDKLLADLEKAFGAVPKADSKPTPVQDPPFEEAKAYAFHDRELPTAYVRIKAPAPSVTAQDAVAARFLFEILSEELGEEIRTKRSLSYAVHSFVIQYSLGIGVITVSTAKPKETIEALQAVLDQIKTKTYSKEELEEYKHVFATAYYLTQETHGSLARALGNSLHYFGTPNEHYDMPRKLDKVTAEDIKRLAGELLGDFRVGVIFGKKDFKDQWVTDFIKKNRRGGPKKTH